MKRTARLWLTVAAAGTVALGAGAAWAAVDDDTLVNLGYDEENHLLLYNTSPTNSPYDCTLENGPVTATYAAGSMLVQTLESEGGAVLFQPRPEEEVDEEFEPATDPVAYGPEGPCGIMLVDVTGPQGQVNHGQVVRAFNQVWEGRGRGCVVHWIAGSEFGKGDQQVRTPDADPAFAPGDTGEVGFMTVLTNCEHGNGQGHGAEGGAAAAGQSSSHRTGPPEHAQGPRR